MNTKTKTSNASRDQKRRIDTIKKEVSKSWAKSQNPNLFGGGPVQDPTGRIVSLDIIAYGFVAEVFEDEYVHDKLIEAFRKNNEQFILFNLAEQQEVKIKKNVESCPPKPPLPIFLMKSYNLQSYLSQLIRHVNQLSGKQVPGGVTWGLNNENAEAPEGWRDDLLEFHKYGGPGTSYVGEGKLPPRLKDLICHYFYLLGVDPNTHAQKIPADYQPIYQVVPPTGDFVSPGWAAPGWAAPGWGCHRLQNVQETLVRENQNDINAITEYPAVEDAENMDNVKFELADKAERNSLIKLAQTETIDPVLCENVQSDEVEVVEIKQELVTTSEGPIVNIEGTPEYYDDQGISLSTEDDSPMSITIHSKGHDPIQITLNKAKPRKRPRHC